MTLLLLLLLLLWSVLQVKVAGLNCESLRPTLVGCGMQC
jgi:hypothetical protein